jgi:alkylation response protein AidB-like acyl-CoA dehydrogenase
MTSIKEPPSIAASHELLAAAEAMLPEICAAADEVDDARRVPDWLAQRLAGAGFFHLLTGREHGGMEADPVTAAQVIETLSTASPSVGWVTMILATASFWTVRMTPDEVRREIFAQVAPGEIQPAVIAGTLVPHGRAERVEGGWRLSGQWPFASGSAHSSWLLAGFRIVRDGAPGPEHMVMAAAIEDVQFVDNWQVMGLKGTGSRDFVLTDHFVADDMAFDLLTTDPRKGGPMFWLGRPGFVTPDHAAFALGVARRALDEISMQAGSYRRGYLTSPIAERGALQHDLGKCDQQLHAARALCREALDEAWEFCRRGQRPDLERQLRLRGACAYATDVACEIATTAFRYGGGNAIYNDRVLQRCLRDINAAAQHFMVNTSAYDNLGQFRLGMPNVNPMG